MPSILVIDNTDMAERDVGKILGEPDAEMQAITGIWEEILKRNFAGYPNDIEKLKDFFLARFNRNSLKEKLQSSLLEEHLKGYAPTEKNQIINNVLSFYENLQRVFRASSGPGMTYLKGLTTQVLAALKAHLISTVGITSLVHLWAALKLGYAIHLQTGITQGLPYGHPLLEMLKNVWTTCVSQVHPYQIGPTNQGTVHSMHNLETLNIINSLPSLNMAGAPPLPKAPRSYISSIPPKRINMEEGALLSSVAALHDIGKAVRDPKTFSHEEIGNKFICANRNVFGIPEDTLASAIAEIVLNHDGKRILNSENIVDSPINYRNRSTMADPIRTRELCALFRLADVLDITFRRVSPIVKDLKETYDQLKGYQREALIARFCIDRVDFNTASHPGKALLICNLTSPPIELENTIAIENDKLENPTAGHSLTIKKRDSTGSIVTGTTNIEDGSDARGLLAPIGAPHMLELAP